MAKDYLTPESQSVEVRQISNGYIVRSTKCCDGEYESSEVFSKEKPDMKAGLTQLQKTPAHGKALRNAISHIRGKR